MSTTEHTVRFRIADDAQATRIEAVLEALGYTVTREIADAPDPLALPIANAVKHFKLSPREATLIDLIVRYGSTHDQISKKLGVSRATVKWHMHNLFAKSNTNSREALLRVVLELAPIQPPPVDRTLESLTLNDIGQSFTLRTPKRFECPDRVYRGKTADGSHYFEDGPSKQTIYATEGWTVQAS